MSAHALWMWEGERADVGLAYAARWISHTPLCESHHSRGAVSHGADSFVRLSVYAPASARACESVRPLGAFVAQRRRGWLPRRVAHGSL